MDEHTLTTPSDISRGRACREAVVHVAASATTRRRGLIGLAGLEMPTGPRDTGAALRRINVGGRSYRGERDQSERGDAGAQRRRGGTASPGDPAERARQERGRV